MFLFVFFFFFFSQDIAPSGDLLRPLLPPNPYLKSLKVDCGRLDDSAISLLLKPSLHELSLHNCADFSGKLLSEIGTRCKDLRFACSPFFMIGNVEITYPPLVLLQFACLIMKKKRFCFGWIGSHNHILCLL